MVRICEPREMFKILFVNQVKCSGYFLWTKGNDQDTFWEPKEMFRILFVNQVKCSGYYLWTKWNVQDTFCEPREMIRILFENQRKCSGYFLWTMGNVQDLWTKGNVQDLWTKGNVQDTFVNQGKCSGYFLWTKGNFQDSVHRERNESGCCAFKFTSKRYDMCTLHHFLYIPAKLRHILCSSFLAIIIIYKIWSIQQLFNLLAISLHLTLYLLNSFFRLFSGHSLGYALFVYRLIVATLIGYFFDDPFLT